MADRSKLRLQSSVYFPDMVVVCGQWIEPGTKGTVVDLPATGDITVRIASGRYVGEEIKLDPQHIEGGAAPESSHASPVDLSDEKLVEILHGIRISEPQQAQPLPGPIVTQLMKMAQCVMPVQAKLTLQPARRIATPFGVNKVEASHKIEFKLDGIDSQRYIRFVRAGMISQSARFQKDQNNPKKMARIPTLKLEHTFGGYVRYKLDESREWPGKNWPEESDRAALVGDMNKLFEKAHWSFDGPKNEFNHELKDRKTPVVIDTPGVNNDGDNPYPIVQRFEFIGVLYDPGIGKVLNVTHYQDAFIALTGKGEVEQLPTEGSRQ